MARLIFRRHALDRLDQRGFTPDDVRAVLATGETIEEEPEALPYPTRLVLGYTGALPLHVLVSEDEEGTVFVITVYRPDILRWLPGWRERRRR